MTKLPASSEIDLGLILRALQFAAHQHRDQRRKDVKASPYINHPIALAGILANEGQVHDTAVICAALLHDTIEDTKTTATELQKAFGKEITGIVKEVTDNKKLKKHVRKRLQVKHAKSLSPKAKLVKLADKIANLRDIAKHPPADWPLSRKQEYFDWAKRVVDGLRGANKRLENQFDRAYEKRPRV